MPFNGPSLCRMVAISRCMLTLVGTLKLWNHRHHLLVIVPPSTDLLMWQLQMPLWIPWISRSPLLRRATALSAAVHSVTYIFISLPSIEDYLAVSSLGIDRLYTLGRYKNRITLLTRVLCRPTFFYGRLRHNIPHACIFLI